MTHNSPNTKCGYQWLYNVHFRTDFEAMEVRDFPIVGDWGHLALQSGDVILQAPREWSVRRLTLVTGFFKFEENNIMVTVNQGGLRHKN